MNLRGYNVGFLSGHIFAHRGRIGPARWEARAWRQSVGSTLQFQTRLSVFGWQFRFEGNRTIDSPKYVRARG